MVATRVSERAAFRAKSRLGAESPNAWIRRSAEVPGAIFEGEHELLWELATRPGEGDVLEIGTFMGKSTCILAGACIERGDGSVVVTVDPFDMAGTEDQRAYHERLFPKSQGTFYEFVGAARRLGFYDHVIPLATFSANALRRGGWSFRLAFLDARHDYDAIEEDVGLSLPYLRVGGVLLFHDAAGGFWPGVERFVDERMRTDPRFRLLAEQSTMVAFERVAV